MEPNRSGGGANGASGFIVISLAAQTIFHALEFQRRAILISEPRPKRPRTALKHTTTTHKRAQWSGVIGVSISAGYGYVKRRAFLTIDRELFMRTIE